MKVHIKIWSFYLLIGFSFLLSCKKTESHFDGSPDGSNVQEKALFPVQLGTGKSKMVFSYTKDHSLSKIEYGDGKSTLIEYNTSGRPDILERYNGTELLSYVQFWTDNNGLPVSADQYVLSNNNYEQTGHCIFSYDANSLLTGISYFDNRDALIYTLQKYYAAGGNLLKDERTASATTVYTYDRMNGLFKNVNYSWLFAIADDNKLLLCSGNNINTCSMLTKPELDEHFSYVYNADKYPETITAVVNGLAVSYKVTYLQIE